jgi:hypothetical protein
MKRILAQVVYSKNRAIIEAGKVTDHKKMNCPKEDTMFICLRRGKEKKGIQRVPRHHQGITKASPRHHQGTQFRVGGKFVAVIGSNFATVRDSCLVGPA